LRLSLEDCSHYLFLIFFFHRGDAENDDDSQYDRPETGIKTDVQEYVNENGERVKVTRLYKVVTKRSVVNANVAARRKWSKFGVCAGEPRGPEKNITYMSHETINLDFRPRKREQVEEDTVSGRAGCLDLF
jgi:hypothetical protein